MKDKFLNHIRDQVWSKVRDQVGRQIYDPVWDQVWDQIWICNQVRWKVERQVGIQREIKERY